ncbi:MAG: hypothetical protein HYU79_00260 [Nitrosomonadales bacterium]|nr:hypothetical protein [Nitrosomonadales bacterium]
MKRSITVIIFCAVAFSAHAQEPADIVCSYAPSQSKAVIGASSAAGGSSAAVLAMAQATGLSVVAHSSGAYILTGAGGYVAGTLGTAIAGPVIVGVGLIVGGAAVTVELLCAPKNHPDQVAKIEVAAQEFARRSMDFVDRTKTGTAPHITRAAIAIKQFSGDVFEYAYRRDR